MAQFESSVEINRPAQVVFDFLIRPANVERLSPPQANMEFIDPPEVFTAGMQFEFHLGGFGPVQRITHEITEVDPPRRYVETLVKGALQSWTHEHIVEAKGDNLCVVTDRIEFEPPGGFVGFLINEGKILHSLEKGFAHRHRELKRLMEQDAG